MSNGKNSNLPHTSSKDNDYVYFNFMKKKDIYGKTENLGSVGRKKSLKDNLIYTGMLKAGKFIIGRKLKGEITEKGLKIPREEIELFKHKIREIFSDLEKMNNLLEEEKGIRDKVETLIEKRRGKRALEKGRELIGLIFWILEYKDKTTNAFYKRLSDLLGEEKDQEQITQTWLKLLTPTKKLYIDEMVEELIKGNNPQFLKHLTSTEEVNDFPKIEKKKDNLVAYKELSRISKYLTEEQEKEVRKWIELITEIQGINEAKNYYWPLVESLRPEEKTGKRIGNGNGR